jgi:outer membrane murein-binding lipoprotein Lpp
MADTPKPEDLAKLYLEFWQRPLAGLTRDPQVAESIARMFDLMTAGAATFAKIVAGQPAGAEDAGVAETGTASSVHPRNAASAATEARLDQIARRVAELERRVARLEPRASARRPGAQSRPRRPRRPN